LIISSIIGFSLKDKLTQAVCPSTTGTLLQCADIFIELSSTISPPTTLPSIFEGSSSDFSYSPPIKGIMLSNKPKLLN